MRSHLLVEESQSAWEPHFICCSGHGLVIPEGMVVQVQALQTLGWGWEAMDVKNPQHALSNLKANVCK